MQLNRFKTDSEPEGLPIARYVRDNPMLAAALSKTTAPLIPTTTEADGSVSLRHVNPQMFRTALSRRAKRNADNEAFLRLLPDLKLSGQILIASILSPKNMMDTELIYELPKDLFGPNLVHAITQLFKSHFNDVYKVEQKLSEMLHEALITKGSYPVAVIPENALDRFINEDRAFTTENYRNALGKMVSDQFDEHRRLKSIGVLGPSVAPAQDVSFRLSLESDHKAKKDAFSTQLQISLEGMSETQCEYVTVLDNPLAFSLSRLNEKIEAQAVRKAYEDSVGLGLEQFRPTELSHQRLTQLITPMRNQMQENVAIMSGQDQVRRKSIGAPLELKLPSESVVPVHVPGDVRNHVGYFIAIDEKGYPVDISEGDQFAFAGGQGAHAGYNASLTSNILRRVEQNLGTDGGVFDIMNDEHVRAASQIYADMVERDLVARVRNGIHGKDVSLAANEDLYRIMLARTLAQKHTQLLYLPKEYLTYIAFDYGADGLGRTILDDQAMINTMRVTLMFVDVIASMRNSTPLTKVQINIPEKDGNPRKTLSKAMDHFLRTRAVQLPSGIGNPNDIVRTINNSGLLWEVVGNNKGLPDLKFDVSQTSTQYPKPDAELRDTLAAQSAMGFYLSPETVNRSSDPEFATTAMHHNILLAKRVMMMQDEFTPQVSAHLRKYVKANQSLLDELRKLVEDQFDQVLMKWEDFEEMKGLKDVAEDAQKKYIIYRALSKLVAEFEVKLPRPTVDTLENQSEDLSRFSEMVDLALNGYLSDLVMTEGTAGEIAQQKETFRGLIKAMLFRSYMAKANLMPELFNLTATTDEGEPMNEFLKESTRHSMALTRAATRAFVSLQPVAKASDKDLAKLGADASVEAGSSEFSGGGGGFGGGYGGGGGDDFGLGGLGGGDDLGMSDLGVDSTLDGANDTGSDPLADPTGDPPADPEGDNNLQGW